MPLHYYSPTFSTLELFLLTKGSHRQIADLYRYVHCTYTYCSLDNILPIMNIHKLIVTDYEYTPCSLFNDTQILFNYSANFNFHEIWLMAKVLCIWTQMAWPRSPSVTWTSRSVPRPPIWPGHFVWPDHVVCLNFNLSH